MDYDSLAILHDHYKESFALIRERERQRDRLFAYLIGIVGALFVFLQYPAVLPNTVHVTSTGLALSLNLPAAALLSVLWMSLFSVSLRYCSYTSIIDRQYTYLHGLEDKLSDRLNEADAYRREGRVYNENYPLVAWWAWIFYTIIFPAVVIVAVSVLEIWEYSLKPSPVAFRVFDVAMGLFVVVTFILYKYPSIARKVEPPPVDSTSKADLANEASVQAALEPQEGTSAPA